MNTIIHTLQSFMFRCRGKESTEGITQNLRNCSTTSGRVNMADETSIQQSNPLSRKLNKILETRLDNDKVS